MLTLVKRIFKDNIGIFVYVYLIQIVLRILKSIVDDAVILKTVYGLWIMIVATLLVFIQLIIYIDLFILGKTFSITR
ncbi:putative membrane protein [Streptococcus troglodytae]|uniref:Putative membrane protein n=1 Tax=Streptococcus troglodytae TaxID=1111760 RepID=A0A1L7LLZ7_9STRE|nr:putative membrane protein [Streptococcus troglodytae]